MDLEIIDDPSLYSEAQVLCTLINCYSKEYQMSEHSVIMEADDSTPKQKESFFKKILNLIKRAANAIVSFFQKVKNKILSKVFCNHKENISKFVAEYSESDVKAMVKSSSKEKSNVTTEAANQVIDVIDNATFAADVVNSALDLTSAIKRTKDSDPKERRKELTKVGAEAGIKVGANAALGAALGPVAGEVTYTGLDILYHILKKGHKTKNGAWFKRKGFTFIQSCIYGLFEDLDKASDELWQDVQSFKLINDHMKNLMATAYSNKNSADVKEAIDRLSRLEKVEDPDNPDAILFILHLDDNSFRKLSEKASKTLDRISKLCADPDKFLPIRMLEKKETRDENNSRRLRELDKQYSTNYDFTVENEFVRYVMGDLEKATKIISLIERILSKNRKKIGELSQLCDNLRFNYKRYKKISTAPPYHKTGALD